MKIFTHHTWYQSVFAFDTSRRQSLCERVLLLYSVNVSRVILLTLFIFVTHFRRFYRVHLHCQVPRKNDAMYNSVAAKYHSLLSSPCHANRCNTLACFCIWKTNNCMKTRSFGDQSGRTVWELSIASGEFIYMSLFGCVIYWVNENASGNLCYQC